MITATIDSTRHNVAMDSLFNAMCATGGDAAKLVEQETRLLSKTIVNFTPPIKSKWGNPKTSGEMAIKAELYSLFSEAEPRLIDEVGSKHGTKDINAFITNANGEKVNLQWANLDPLGSRMDEYHEKFQNRRGKVPRTKASGSGVWKARVVVPKGSRDPYIKKLQARVGRARASFAQTAARLGATFPSWISRHFGAPISDIAIMELSGLQNPVSPSVVFGSRAPGIDRVRDRVQAAVNFRAKVIVRKVKLILSGYNKDIAAGIKAQSQAYKFDGEASEVVE